MRVEELKIYTFEELSKDAQEKAINDYKQGTYYFIFADELEKSLIAITDAINCKYKLYSYDGVTVDITLNSKEANEVLNLNGTRAYKFIYNNYIKPYRKGKYLTHYKNKAIYSKVIFNYDSVFTGVCFDMVLFDCFKEFTELIKNGKNLTIQDFINLVAEKYGEVWTNSNEYELSNEFIIDTFINNDYEFLEDGTKY